MMGLAGRPGTEVDPTCSMAMIRPPRASSSSERGGGEPVGPGRVVVLDDDVVPPRRALPDQGDGILLRGAMEALRDFLRVLANSTSANSTS